MSSYQNILVAVESNKGAKDVLVKAAMFAKIQTNPKVHVVHVVLDLIIADWAGMPGEVPPPIDQEEIIKSSAEFLKPMIEQVGLDPNNLIICTGSPAHAILKQADNLKCDLIIAGSHSRRGLEILLGSTAHKILNLAKCDVLLIRVPKE